MLYCVTGSIEKKGLLQVKSKQLTRCVPRTEERVILVLE